MIADVAVVGGGPAGAAAAITLARAGRRVVLVDKATFPRDKCCGDGLTAGALRLLEDLGLDPASVASWHDGRRRRRPLAVGPRGHARRCPRGMGTFAAVARRTDLDAAAARRGPRRPGVEVHEGIAVTGVEPDAERIVRRPSTADGTVAGAATSSPPTGCGRRCASTLGAARPATSASGTPSASTSPASGREAAPRAVRVVRARPPARLRVVVPAAGRSGQRRLRHRPRRAARSTGCRTWAELWPDLLARPAHPEPCSAPTPRPRRPHRAWPIPARVDGIARTRGRRPGAVRRRRRGGHRLAHRRGHRPGALTGVLAAEAVLAAGPGRPSEAAAELRPGRRPRPRRRPPHVGARCSGRCATARAPGRAAGWPTPTTGPGATSPGGCSRTSPGPSALTPRRWHRGFLRRPGAFTAGTRARNDTLVG